MPSAFNLNRFPSAILIIGLSMAAVGSRAAVASEDRTHSHKRKQAKLAPTEAQQRQSNTHASKVQMFDGNDGEMHVGRVISFHAVAAKGAPVSSRAAGSLALGDPCSCDEDCDAALGDQCNLVQCIVRSRCTGDDMTPCENDADCTDNGNCNTAAGSFVQRCDTIPLIDWPCDADTDFCTLDLCQDDPLGTGNAICMEQDDGTGSSTPLSPCAKQCAGGAAQNRRCDRPGDCPQGACRIATDGFCDTGTAACYVGLSVDAAIGRCCAADLSCTEKTLPDCTAASGTWYRYRDPEEEVGDGNCLCPKYGSGVSPPGDDLGSIGLVRPSGLMCQLGSPVVIAAGGNPVYCEDSDGDGIAPRFCQKRCSGGDNEGAVCVHDNPGCAALGACSSGGATCIGGANDGLPCTIIAQCPGGIICNPDTPCIVADLGADCPAGSVCSGDGITPCANGIPDCLGNGICEPVEQCNGIDPGTCIDNPCAANTIEGGCEDGFLSVGDDYALMDGSFLRLSQFRFRGGVTNLGEDIVIEFWDSTGTLLVDAFAVNNLERTGTHDWTIEVDCFPNCDFFQNEEPDQTPIIIPPNGYVVMRSPRTVGTINGAAAFWEQTESPPDKGSNDSGKSWVDGDPNASLGTNVFIFELVGTSVDDPLGACCDDASTCENTLRWECGICTESESTILCASTLHDCPVGGLSGSLCQFNRWFGPISHTDFVFGGAELQLCDNPGVSPAPCDSGACCDGESCTVTTEVLCAGAFQGIATDCTPNCCPVINPTGSDCICSTSICVDELGALTGFVCEVDADCDQALGPQTCVLQCEPNGTTQLRHPYECFDDFPTPLIPARACDPANGNADCTTIPCTGDGDCTKFETCSGGFCTNSAAYTCGQSFDLSVTTSRNDTIAGDLFIAEEGETCSLNTNADRVGWYELINLPDLTPGDSVDDCFVLTIDLGCTDPILSPIWPFLSSFRNCPCLESADVVAHPPDTDELGEPQAGFGHDSKARLPRRSDDGNFSATFTLPPGDYAYQIYGDKSCALSIIACDTDEDCPGTSCVVPNRDYFLNLTVESCPLAACCLGDTCVVTNKLICAELEGNFLGDGDQPVNVCGDDQLPDICEVGSCCFASETTDFCNSSAPFDTPDECEYFFGSFFGGVNCDANPCPTCPFDTFANCQKVQTIFGPVGRIDRNPDNGGGISGQVIADDVKFCGNQVDSICWNTGFFQTPCCDAGCVPQAVDVTWQIRVYKTNPACSGLPGTEIGMSTITVRNKIQGTGQARGTWQYAGSLDTPIDLTLMGGNPGCAGDTYWFEISGFGSPGCEVRSVWSRDQGNEHSVQTALQSENDPRVYELAGVRTDDLGFCEDSGISNPGPVLGACCTCPLSCTDDLTQQECNRMQGVWTACENCNSGPCSDVAANDNCFSALPVSGVPTDGGELLVPGDNGCASDDGPSLRTDGGCRQSLFNHGGMHDDVWYSYTAVESGDLRIHSCNDATNDQMIAVYKRPQFGCPVIDSDEIVCGDDTCGVDRGPGSVIFRVNVGDEYLIRVGGWNDEVPGGFTGNPRGTFTLHWSLALTCPRLEPPILSIEPNIGTPIRKNRYISIDPRGATRRNPDTHQIRVTLVSTEVVDVFVGQIGSDWWANDPDANCISIVGPSQPTSEPNWGNCETVHLTGCPIIPTSVYSIDTVSDGDVSEPSLVAETQRNPVDNKWWCDAVGVFNGSFWTGPQGVTNFDDVNAALKTFQDPNAINATHVSWTDIHPNRPDQGGLSVHPNKIVSIDDVFQFIQAFQGAEYPGGDLASCTNP